MQIFDFPYIIITILVLCFIVLGIVGLYFAIQGYKTAKGTEEKDFLSVSKLENIFYKSVAMRSGRCLIYINLSLDNVRSLYSDSKAWSIFNDIKPLLLKILSGDENSGISLYDQKNFIAVCTGSAQKAKESAEICLAETNKRLLRHESINLVNIRIGAYCTNSTEVSFDEAINRAKQACTLAVNEDIPYVEWNSSIGKSLEKKIKIENNIENEINNNRFFLEYQPILDAKTKKIIGAEVLSRLNSQNDGVLTPRSFLSAVDSVGINDKFDYYIFEKNCKWISNNKEQREKFKYTINFSRSTMCDPTFAGKVTEIIEKYNLSYSAIAIEILEDKDIVGDARNRMIQNLSTLKEKGISILLDDFGSGYTTFGDLHSLDIHTVKIDKSITQKSNTETGFLILKNVIRTAKELGFKTVCEGIETPEQEKAATKAGCDMLQGYYYYKPMPVTKLEKLFEDNDL